MSTASGAGSTAASDVDKAGTSAPLAFEGEGGDLCTLGLLSAPGPQAAREEGARSEDDQDWCLYVGTPWEAQVIADRRDLEEFKEASRTIGRVMSVRALVDPFGFLALGCSAPQGLMARLLVC
jgi:hypothetical protein